MNKLHFKRILLIVLALIVISAGLIYFYVSYQLDQVKQTEIPKDKEILNIKEDAVIPDTSITNIALLGVDADSTASGRSDAIIILSIDKKHNKIKLLSIMRDTYVDVEDYGMTKITHAYAYGGPLLAIKTINSNFNLNIENFIAVDFIGFKNIIDRIGGVDIQIKTYELTGMSTLNPKSEGIYTLNGEQALQYVRIRHEGHGDYERTDRQRAVLSAIFSKIISSNLSIAKSSALISELLPYTETSLGKPDILKLGTSILTSEIKTVDSIRFPLDGYSESKIIGGVYYLVTDLQETSDLMRGFIYDDMVPTEE